MLDGRFHRLALVLLVTPAVVLAAFSLRPSVLPRTAALAPDAFDGAAARTDFRALESIPNRAPGSPGDDLAAELVAKRLKAAGFEVSKERVESQTVEGERSTVTVIARRTGFLQRKVVIAADRSTAAEGASALSGTAALLEIGRALAGRTLGHSVELVSTGAGPGGDLAGWDPGPGNVVAALVLGDLSGGRLSSPFVVPWAEMRASAAPVALERSVAAAIRSETGLQPGRTTIPVRIARLALPLTTTEQGGLVAAGIPVVTMSSTGEKPGRGERLTPAFDGFGRAALRVAGVLDGAPGTWPGSNSAALPLRDRELPPWTLRLIAGMTVLAALVTGIDGLARSRRRRIPVAESAQWLASTWPAMLLGWLWLLLASATGVIGGVPLSTAPAGTVPVSWVALAGIPVSIAFGWLVLRPVALRRHSGLARPGPAAPAALMLLASVAAAIVWTRDPLTALLIVPFAHVVPWLVDPVRAPSRRVSLLLIVVVLVPFLAALEVLAAEFGAGPIGFTWMLVLVFAGGSAGLGAGLVTTLMAALLVSAVMLASRPRSQSVDGLTTRGPVTYAGPGSLGASD